MLVRACRAAARGARLGADAHDGTASIGDREPDVDAEFRRARDEFEIAGVDLQPSRLHWLGYAWAGDGVDQRPRSIADSRGDTRVSCGSTARRRIRTARVPAVANRTCGNITNVSEMAQEHARAPDRYRETCCRRSARTGVPCERRWRWRPNTDARRRRSLDRAQKRRAPTDQVDRVSQKAVVFISPRTRTPRHGYVEPNGRSCRTGSFRRLGVRVRVAQSNPPA